MWSTSSEGRGTQSNAKKLPFFMRSLVVLLIFSLVILFHQMESIIEKPDLTAVTVRGFCEQFPTQQEDWKDAVHAWMHIPKTAGTTSYNMFMKALEKNNFTIYPRGNVYDYNTPGCAKEEDRKDPNFRFGGTHCARSEIQDCLSQLFPERPHKFYTVIRHPVERVISEYFWWKGGNTPAWTPSMHATKKNLTEWVLDKGNVANNRQVIYFLLDEEFANDCTAWIGKKTLKWIENEFGSTNAFNNKHTITHHALDKFSFVAIMEDMNKSAAQFKKLFGVNALSVHSSKIDFWHTAKKKPVDLSLRKLIEDRNRLDMMLYRMAKARLDC